MSIYAKGPVIGKFMGRDIHESLTYSDGSRYEFVRAGVLGSDSSFQMSQLADDEAVIAPGLIYRRAA